MKTFIYTIIYCCTILSVSAQNVDFETTMRDGFFTYPNKILPLSNGEIIIFSEKYESGGWGRNPLQINKLDASGNLIWTNTYSQYGYFHYFGGTAVGADNSIYLSFVTGECDYLANYIMMKLDSDGNDIWIKTNNDTLRSFKGLKMTADGGFWTLTNLGLYKYDSNGNHIQTIELPSPYIYNFDYNISTEEFVIPFRDTDDIIKLMRVGADGSTQEIELIEQVFLPEVYFRGDDVLVKYYRDILKYDRELNLVSSIKLPKAYPILNFEDEYIYIAHNEYEYSSFDRNHVYSDILKLNENLEIIDNARWQYGDITDIKTIDKALYISGSEYKHTYLKEINDDFTHTNLNTDIGVVDIVATGDSTCIGSNYCPVCNYDVTGIQVLVQNFGTETINYFELNTLYYNGCGSICYDAQSAMMIYDNVNLAPGETHTVDFPNLNLWNQPRDTRMCLYTTRPNKLLDKDHDNDRTCSDFEVLLPIEELTPLQAEINNKSVLLTWETATEINNEGFEIQKSKDGITWQKIAWVAGQGNSATLHTYRHIDEDLLSGITYYRFKQIDYDGNFSYSNIVSISYAGRGIRVYPNPVKNTLYFSDLNGENIQNIIIYDQTGRQVMEANEVNHSIDISALPTGIYMLKIGIQGGILYEKIVVE